MTSSKVVTEHGHTLLTPETCKCDKKDHERQCPVCDWGLGVCGICGAAEIELEEDCRTFHAKTVLNSLYRELREIRDFTLTEKSMLREQELKSIEKVLLQADKYYGIAEAEVKP